MARTEKVWEPLSRPGEEVGDVHVPNGPPSRRHSKDEPLSVEVKEKSAVVRAAGFGGEAVIVVSGATLSTVTARVADAGDMLPATSTATAEIGCGPSDRPVTLALQAPVASVVVAAAVLAPS